MQHGMRHNFSCLPCASAKVPLPYSCRSSDMLPCYRTHHRPNRYYLDDRLTLTTSHRWSPEAPQALSSGYRPCGRNRPCGRKKAPILYIQNYGLGTKDGVVYEAAGRSATPLHYAAVAPRAYRACGPHRGESGCRCAPLSVSDDVGAAIGTCRGLAAWARFFWLRWAVPGAGEVRGGPCVVLAG